MSVATVITKPSPIVSFEEVERHLADVPAEDKAYVEGLVSAATAWVDGPAGWLGRSLGVQLLELSNWFGCERINLPYGPVIEIESIIVDNLDGSDLVADPSTYRLRNDCLAVSPGAPWVTRPNQRVRYWAGYGERDADDATKWVNDAPAPIKMAIMMLVAQWFNTREAVNIGNIVNELPFGVDALLQTYRVYR